MYNSILVDKKRIFALTFMTGKNVMSTHQTELQITFFTLAPPPPCQFSVSSNSSCSLRFHPTFLKVSQNCSKDGFPRDLTSSCDNLRLRRRHENQVLGPQVLNWFGPLDPKKA